MKSSTYLIYVDDIEQRILLNALMQLRNNQIKEGKSHDCLNELIIKICEASEKSPKGKLHAQR